MIRRCVIDVEKRFARDRDYMLLAILRDGVALTASQIADARHIGPRG